MSNRFVLISKDVTPSPDKGDVTIKVTDLQIDKLTHQMK